MFEFIWVWAYGPETVLKKGYTYANITFYLANVENKYMFKNDKQIEWQLASRI